MPSEQKPHEDPPSTRSSVPIAVDLDGTLIHTDLLVESALLLLKKNPLYAFLLPWWLLKGKAHLKHEIAQRVDIDITCLPYNQAFLSFLLEQREAGRRLVLATASHEKYAHEIADHLKIFEDVIATDRSRNLTGKYKSAAIQSHHAEFDYAGNSLSDIPIWIDARHGLLVGSTPRRARRITRNVQNVEQFGGPTEHFTLPLLRAMRIQQWIKNLLLFVPATMAHVILEWTVLADLLLAFFAYGLFTSGLYLFNDLIDLEQDRYHPKKKHRPFAAGSLPLGLGLILIPLLLGTAGIFALFLPLTFLFVLGLHGVTTLIYSLLLKKAVLLDVLTLAGLYTLRLFGGGAAVQVEISFWLIAFSMFLFLSLALVKRYAELKAFDLRGELELRGRGYRVVDLESLSQFGIASAFLAVLVLALYINSESVLALYSEPRVIWLLCPMLLYLVARMWLLARRGELDDDPISFVITDSRSLLALLGAVVLLALAI